MSRSSIVRTLFFFMTALVPLPGGPAVSPARAAVSISVDAATLNALLPALAPQEIQVPLGGQGNTVRLQLADLVVTGFEPASDGGATGRILTSLRVLAPQLGLDLPVAPRIAIDVEDRAGDSVLVLRFEKLLLSLIPGTPGLDISSALPPLRFPVEGAFDLAAPRGEVRIDSRVTSVNVGSRYVRFDLDLRPAAAP
jgi:hypothetical protein